jgi:hypothetical protein
MKKVAIIIVLALVTIVAGVIGAAAATQPDRLHVERSVTIAATAEQVVPHLTDYRRFVAWSPWSGRDPDQKSTFSEETGLGSWYAWEGNADVGKGKMEITKVSDGEVVHRVTFIEPFESVADAAMRWKTSGDGVTVTWAYDGDADLPTKVMCLFVDFEGMLAPDYEKGLEQLKKAVESGA